MSIDNDGEGGILALMALVADKARKRPVIVAIGLVRGGPDLRRRRGHARHLGAVGAGGPRHGRPVLPALGAPGAVAILVALFVIQPFGTARIGKAFGPVMAVWFLTLAVMGVAGLLHHPSVLAAINPLYAVSFLPRAAPRPS